MFEELKNKNVFVSGGSHGIGKSIVIEFAKLGCNVNFLGRTDSNVKETIRFINETTPGTHNSFVVDVLQEFEYHNFLNRIDKLKIDILINNVGGGGRWGEDNILKTPRSVWNEVYEKNVKPMIDLTLMFLPNMMMKEWGRIITISSRLGKEAGGRPWFTMAKAAEIAMMKELSLDKNFTNHNITFNTICPGAIDIKGTGWDGKEEKKDDIPVGRMGTLSDISSMTLFLCSEDSGFINGSCITIDGGESKSF